jgi:hypothetical protein
MDRAEAHRLASVIVALREMFQDAASMPASSTVGSLSTASIDAGFCERMRRNCARNLSAAASVSN